MIILSEWLDLRVPVNQIMSLLHSIQEFSYLQVLSSAPIGYLTNVHLVYIWGYDLGRLGFVTGAKRNPYIYYVKLF